MLGHDLAVAFRSFSRNRLHTGISVAVLALGLVCFISAHMFVSYLRGYDRQFANSGRTYVVAQSLSAPSSGLSMPLQPWSSSPLAERIRLDVPELAAVARYFHSAQTFVEAKGVTERASVAYVDPSFFQIFNFDAVGGNLKGALARPRTAVITESAAERLFGTRDVVGRQLTLVAGKHADVTIEAVIADLPSASHLSTKGLFANGFELLVSWDVFERIAKPPYFESWGNVPVYTYVLLPRDGSFGVGELNRRLAEVVAPHVPGRPTLVVGLEARPVSTLSAAVLQRQFQGSYGSPWRLRVLSALLLFAALILLVSCLNFINLATAHSIGRSREIGTRKVVGAKTAQIVRQDLLRTALLATAAVVLALAALVPVRHMLSLRWQAPFEVPWAEPRFWGFIAALILAVTLAAGLFPALVLACIRPVEAFRLGAIRAGSRFLRNLLSASQFAAASFLIIAVIILLAQRSELRTALLGRFDDSYVLVQPSVLGPAGGDANAAVLAAELLKDPAIKGVTWTSQMPFTSSAVRYRFSREPGERSPKLTFENVRVGTDYFSLLDVPLLAGRLFAADRAADAAPESSKGSAARGSPESLVLDRAAVRALGWTQPADAIGKLVYRYGQSPFVIIGVVETEPLTIRTRGSAGVSYVFAPTAPTRWAWIIARISKGPVAAERKHINAVLRMLAPDRPPLRVGFLAGAFRSAYGTFAMIDRVFASLALFAIAIASVGLFGMASYMSQRRTREIGVRKTQGASSVRILRMLLWDFSKPVLIANLVVWPFAFIAAQRYLGLFAERIAITPFPFLLALLATLLIAWLAVGGRVLRAARLRPSDVLRHE